VDDKPGQVGLLGGGNPRVAVLLVKGLQLGKELVPPGVGIEGKGRSRQDGRAPVSKVAAAKAAEKRANAAAARVGAEEKRLSTKVSAADAPSVGSAAAAAPEAKGAVVPSLSAS